MSTKNNIVNDILMNAGLKTKTLKQDESIFTKNSNLQLSCSNQLKQKKCINLKIDMNVTLSNSSIDFETDNFMSSNKVSMDENCLSLFPVNSSDKSKIIPNERSLFKRVISFPPKEESEFQRFQPQSSFNYLPRFNLNGIQSSKNYFPFKKTFRKENNFIGKRNFLNFDLNKNDLFKEKQNLDLNQNRRILKNVNILMPSSLNAEKLNLNNLEFKEKNEKLKGLFEPSKLEEFIFENENLKNEFNDFISKINIQNKNEKTQENSNKNLKLPENKLENKTESFSLNFDSSFYINCDIIGNSKKKNLIDKILNDKKVFKEENISAEELSTFFNLHLNYENSTFEGLSESIKLKFFLLFFARYVNKAEVSKLFEDFWEDININTSKALKKNKNK